MESHHFWAFFVIALIAGGAITLAISNATMTGYAFWDVFTHRREIVPTSICVENWQCAEWGPCINSIQERICTDLNNCGTVVNKSIESKSCEAPINCSDCQNVLSMLNRCDFIGTAPTSWMSGDDVCKIRDQTCLFVEARQKMGDEFRIRIGSCNWKVNPEDIRDSTDFMTVCCSPMIFPKELANLKSGATFDCGCCGVVPFKFGNIKAYKCGKQCEDCSPRRDNNPEIQGVPSSILSLREKFKAIEMIRGADEEGYDAIICGCGGAGDCVMFEVAGFPGAYDCRDECGGKCKEYGITFNKDIETEELE